MALTRRQKEELVANYKEDIKSSKNVVLLKQYSISVNDINILRSSVYEAWWKMSVIKKRIFHSTASSEWLSWVDLADMPWSVIALYAFEDDYAPLKAVSKILKQWKKEKKEFELDYLGWWFESEWKDSSYVEEIANLPSRDELLSKFAFLANYPVRSFAVVVDQIAKSKWE